MDHDIDRIQDSLVVYRAYQISQVERVTDMGPVNTFCEAIMLHLYRNDKELYKLIKEKLPQIGICFEKHPSLRPAIERAVSLLPPANPLRQSLPYANPSRQPLGNLSIPSFVNNRKRPLDDDLESSSQEDDDRQPRKRPRTNQHLLTDSDDEQSSNENQFNNENANPDDDDDTHSFGTGNNGDDVDPHNVSMAPHPLSQIQNIAPPPLLHYHAILKDLPDELDLRQPSIPGKDRWLVCE